MLSGKVDNSTMAEIEDKSREPLYASADADATAAAAADPSNPLLAQEAAESAKIHANIVKIAKRAKIMKASLPDPPRLCVTNAAHIFSESTNTDLDDEKNILCIVGSYSDMQSFVFERDYASSISTVMERFGQRGFMDELDGSNIHRLANIMTLDHLHHTSFDNLSLWLEPDDVS
jgi:hypothetical protein